MTASGRLALVDYSGFSSSPTSRRTPPLGFWPSCVCQSDQGHGDGSNPEEGLVHSPENIRKQEARL